MPSSGDSRLSWKTTQLSISRALTICDDFGIGERGGVLCASVVTARGFNRDDGRGVIRRGVITVRGFVSADSGGIITVRGVNAGDSGGIITVRGVNAGDGGGIITARGLGSGDGVGGVHDNGMETILRTSSVPNGSPCSELTSAVDAIFANADSPAAVCAVDTVEQTGAVESFCT